MVQVHDEYFHHIHNFHWSSSQFVLHWKLQVLQKVVKILQLEIDIKDTKWAMYFFLFKIFQNGLGVD